MRLLRFIKEHALFLATMFLLAFIPLYPKLPLLDIKNTWVYVRIEDFLVVFVLLFWFVLLIKKKVTLKTPLTIPIILYWIIGGIATIHGVVLIFPTIAGVFPNLALLSFLRRIEYMSVFFVAYSSMKEKKLLKYAVFVLLATLLIVIFYGFGQRYFGFPAFLTMNEEFAKGEAIQLSALSRVPSTFAGHYDLAAFLVLVLPIFSSLFFGTKKIIAKGVLVISVLMGIALLFMTVSRVSFVVFFLSLMLILLFYKRKLAILLILVGVIVTPFFVMRFTPALLERFGNTVKEVDVLVDANTGEVIGSANVVPKTHFQNNLVIQRQFQNANSVVGDAKIQKDELEKPQEDTFLRYLNIPQQATLVIPPNAPTGESLPQGTAYINLSLSPVIKRLGEFFYENPSDSNASTSAISYVFHGSFLVKRASAYDLSFTTRFQGEWPHALLAFSRNIFLGSGYSSVSLAVDNDYLRLLGETGLLGFVSFLLIFLTIGIVIKKSFQAIDSAGVKSFVVGFATGVFGLLLNAFLIDVFEASKVAFVLWILSGITLGALALYKDRPIHVYKDILSALTSTGAVIVYLFVLTVILYLPMLQNYFVADDYTWLRWAASCTVNAPHASGCGSPLSTIFHYFTAADGFFYRPGTKIYFYLMYPLFWLNQNVYHAVSLLLEFCVGVCVFLLARKVFRTKLEASLTAFLFLIMSGYMEVVVWISATGHLISALFVFVSLLFFIGWHEKKKTLYLLFSVAGFCMSLLFYEAGLVTPLLILLYLWFRDESFSFKRSLKMWQLDIFAAPIVAYGLVRYAANSHWTGGDYSYNLIKLPFNVVGNALGYLMISVIGPLALSPYESVRTLLKNNLPLAAVGGIILICVGFLFYRYIFKLVEQGEKRLILFGFFFFIISLLPFLGFGNISPRYSYVGAFGIAVLLVLGLRKSYVFLKDSGRDVALGGVSVILLAFSLLQIIQAQQVHTDWDTAGQKAQRFFISIDSLYSDYWSQDPMTFHFINVPVRENQAWIFPPAVLPDALWFVFRNPQIQIQTWASPDDVFKQIHSASRHEKVFGFTGSGDVVEYKTIQDTK